MFTNRMIVILAMTAVQVSFYVTDS